MAGFILQTVGGLPTALSICEIVNNNCRIIVIIWSQIQGENVPLSRLIFLMFLQIEEPIPPAMELKFSVPQVDN
jgi:hypothetical protein